MSKKVFVFTSNTCAPCKVLKPAIQKIQTEKGFDMEILVLEEGSPLFRELGVRAVPTVVCIEGSTEIGRFSGGVSTIALENHIESWGL